MSHYEAELNRVIEEIQLNVQPLACLVIPRLAEQCLLITVSETESQKYLSRVAYIHDLQNSQKLAECIAEIRCAFYGKQSHIDNGPACDISEANYPKVTLTER